MTTQTLRPDPQTETDEPDVAHIVMKDDQMLGYLEGTPIRALCGVVFVPSKDFEGLPVCKECQDKKDKIMAAKRGAN